MVLGKVLGGTLLALAQGLLFLAAGPARWASGSGSRRGVRSSLLLFVVGVGLTALGFVIAWRMDSTQGFHAIMSVFLMPMWLLERGILSAARLGGIAELGQRLLALVMAANPLTYGVAALRRLIYRRHGRRRSCRDTPVAGMLAG